MEALPKAKGSSSKWQSNQDSLHHADPGRVLQVLINLIDNAIKFTPADGSVTVKAYLTDADPTFGYLVVDTGQGISPESKTLIFERLYQDPNSTDNSRKGWAWGSTSSRNWSVCTADKSGWKANCLTEVPFLYAALIFSREICCPRDHRSGQLAGHTSL